MGDPKRYDASMIQLLDGIAAIRKRPWIHVGTTDSRGIERMVLELVSNSLVQHLLGHAQRISVNLAKDGWIEVEDDGRGISLEVEDGVIVAERALTRTFGYGTSAEGPASWVWPLGSVGLPTVNALASRLEMTTHRESVSAALVYERGQLVEPLRSLSGNGTRGTRIRFKPDTEFFGDASPDLGRLRKRLVELARLAPRVTWLFQGERLDGSGGLASWVPAVRSSPLRPDAVIATTLRSESLLVDIAVAWRATSGLPKIVTFANFVKTYGRSQLDGVLRALRTILPEQTEGHLLRGVVGVVHVAKTHTMYRRPGLSVLLDPEAEDAIASALIAAMAPRRGFWERFLREYR